MVICAKCHELDRIHLSLSLDCVLHTVKSGGIFFTVKINLYVNLSSIESWYRCYAEWTLRTHVRCRIYLIEIGHKHRLFVRPICTIISDKSFKVQTYNGLRIHLLNVPECVFDSLVFIIWMLCGVIRYHCAPPSTTTKALNCEISVIR